MGTIKRDDIIENCKKYLGRPYVWGGESMEEGGYDCSGLVYRVLSGPGTHLHFRLQGILLSHLIFIRSALRLFIPAVIKQGADFNHIASAGDIGIGDSRPRIVFCIGRTADGFIHFPIYITN